MVNSFLSIYIDLYIKKEIPEEDNNNLNIIKIYLNDLKESKDTIKFIDHGAGTNHKLTKLDNDYVNVNEKYKMSIKENQQHFLYFLTQYFYKIKNNDESIPLKVLELGTGFGVSCLCFSTAVKYIVVETIEACEELSNYTSNLQLNYNIENKPHIINGLFKDEIPKLEGKYDIIFIDGHNIPQNFESYFVQLSSKLEENSIIISRNIHWVKKGLENEKTLFDSDRKSVV